MTGNDTNAKETTMNAKSKTQWVVMKDGQEVGRLSSKRIAGLVASEIGGYVVRYRKEWV